VITRPEDASAVGPKCGEGRPLAIEIVDLWKAFDGRPVFKGLSLGIRKAEAVAIIGGSGSGKSVLLKHIVGLLQPDRGTIRIGGMDLATSSRDELERLREKIGYLFQGGALLNSISVFDNVALPLRERMRWDENHVRHQVMEHLEMVGLADAASKRPAELSGGMRKRAGLARALVTNPEIVLYDEPTAGLDPVTGAQIAGLIRDLHVRLKVTSVLVTHDMPLALAIAERIALLSGGVIYRTGTPSELEASGDPAILDFIGAGRARG
jgi:phospholipid/cholesterol/gamma-HCH transport system ATP-binding protein